MSKFTIYDLEKLIFFERKVLQGGQASTGYQKKALDVLYKIKHI